VPERGREPPGGQRAPRAVLFDFNGTLCNDEPVLLRLYTRMFREHLDWALTPDDYWARFAGRSDREIVESAVARTRPEDGPHPEEAQRPLVQRLLAERQRRYREAVARSSPIADGTARLVRRLAQAGTALGIVTGAQRADVDFVLAHSAVDGLIPVLVTEEDVRRGKPDPEGFLLGARELGVAPEDVVAFEDSLPGLRAARAAGMRTVGVAGTCTRGQLAAEADVVVEALGPDWPEGLPGAV